VSGDKRSRRGGGRKGEGAKGVGIGKEFDKLAAIILTWVQEQQRVVEKLLQDREFVEDLLDIAVIEQRRSEPSRSLEEYLAERKS
jgi:hypothetical protein